MGRIRACHSIGPHSFLVVFCPSRVIGAFLTVEAVQPKGIGHRHLDVTMSCSTVKRPVSGFCINWVQVEIRNCVRCANVVT